MLNQHAKGGVCVWCVRERERERETGRGQQPELVVCALEVASLYEATTPALCEHRILTRGERAIPGTASGSSSQFCANR